MDKDDVRSMLTSNIGPEKPYEQVQTEAKQDLAEDELHAANEREQVQQVFGLTGGELMDVAWVPTYPRTITDYVVDVGYVERVEATPFTFPYWYQGVPEYVEREFDALPLSYAPTYRTVCEQELYGMAPETVTDDEGTWKRVARFSTSGETECPGKNGSIPGVADERGLNIMDTPCPLCDENPQSFHGYIYIGDGWAEIVYRLVVATCATCGSTIDVTFDHSRGENVCQSCADDYATN